MADYMALLAPKRKPAHSEAALVGSFGSRDDARRIAAAREYVAPLTSEQRELRTIMNERKSVCG